MTDASVKGHGLIYHTDMALREEVKSGKLKLVLEEFSPVEDGFHIYFPNRHQVLPKLRALIDYLKVR